MATSGSEQQLRFRWNDHMQHISKVLTLQRLEEQFCDVTLVSEDGYVMKAHQAILASSSAYFQRAFSDITSDQHPMVVLRGANFREMSCLLDYMYQGSTQVHQSLMESVLEVADMLEVKGLSQIRSNNSIKKFMGPASTSSATSTKSPPAHPADNSRGRSRSPDDHCKSHSSDEQLYRDSQSRSAELDSLWMRFQGNAVVENRSKDPVHPPVEGHITDEPLPSSHTRRAACQDSNTQEVLEESQMSGIDLSMAKNEPWSPKEPSLNEDKNSPSRKRRKLVPLENICSEETLEPVSDPDWGRIGSKMDEKTVCQPQTISFSSITSPERNSKLQQNQSPPSKSKEGLSSSKPLVEKTLEVPCEDGPLTISITTGQDLNGWRNIIKRKPLFCSSLPLKRVRRRNKVRRALDENRKRWLAKERRSLFGSDTGERPVTRALERLKRKAVSSEGESMEKLHVNCDPPFPTDDDAAKANRDKENMLSLKSTSEENKKLSSNLKAASANAKDNPSWELTDKRVDDDKYQESSEDLKFPAINPLSLFTLPPVKEREKQTRTTLTLEEKVKVIEAFLDGKSQRKIAHLYGIGKTQVSGIIKRREEILTTYRDSILRGEKLTMKRQRKSEYALLNQHLIQWYRHMTVVTGVKITTGMLRAKALQIAPELGYHDFKASNGWLATFKANNNLKFSKQRKNDSYDDQGNYDNESNHRDDDESFFEDAEADNSSSHLPSAKQYPGQSNIASVTVNHDGTSSDVTGNKASQNEDSPPTNQADQTGALIHPGLSVAGASKAPQMVNTSLGANLTAAYNLSRDLTRDISRGDSASVGDLSTTTMNASPLNHPVSALNVSRAVIDNPLTKPSDAALATYKSEEPLAYGYDHQNRMNDASTRGAEYNYTPYGFPGSYYSYHFLGQY